MHPTDKPGWDVPGGVVEEGESPAEGCRREIAEELGLDRATGAFLSVDHTRGDGSDGGTDGGRYDRRRMSPSCTTEATSTPSRV